MCVIFPYFPFADIFLHRFRFDPFVHLFLCSLVLRVPGIAIAIAEFGVVMMVVTFLSDVFV